jgi:DNA-binding NarL/FixJ family response regulator
MGVIQVAVVAHPPALRAGLRAMLESTAEVEVMAEASSLGEMLPVPSAVEVLVLATPLALPDADSGLLEAHLPLPPLLLLSDEPMPDMAFLTSLSHAWGVLPLEASSEELLAAVNAVHAGLSVMAPPLAQAFFSQPGLGIRLPRESPQSPMLEPLTEREMQVLQWLGRGLANKQIAAALGISEHTVKFHVSAIYAKLGATNRAEAVRLGIQRGLVTL